MEKKQDDARNTETEKKPDAAVRGKPPMDVAPDTVSDVELTSEKATGRETEAHKAAADKPAGGSPGGPVPPTQAGKGQSSAGKDGGSAGKGTKGPLIGAVVVVAAIAAGGYYYAQHNRAEPDSSSSSISEPVTSGASDQSAADTSQTGPSTGTDSATAPSDSASDTTPTDTNSNQADTSATTSDETAAGNSESTDSATDENASPGDTGTPAQDEASGSTTSTPLGPTATNSEPASEAAQSEDDSTGQAADADNGTQTGTPPDNTGDAASDQDTASQSPDAAETQPATATNSESGATAAPASGSFTGSLPADIRDQLDRQSAQIIALRDQLESSQKQLEQLQTSRLQASRNETNLFVLNDVSRLVTMAQNELAIAGNLDNAVASLETAIKAIDQADAPVLAGLRAALSADIVTLKSAPAASVDTHFKQVTQLSAKLDALPLISPDQAGAKPMAGQAGSAPGIADSTEGAAPDAAAGPWYERAWNEVKTWPGSAWQGLRSDLGGIVRVEKLADPNQVLLTVDQAAQLRANLKQHLHFAQQALLNGQQGIWTSSLETVVQGIRQSFNQDSVQTQQVLAQLQQLLKAGVRPELPPITQSVKAVQETRKQLKSMNPGQE